MKHAMFIYIQSREVRADHKLSEEMWRCKLWWKQLSECSMLLPIAHLILNWTWTCKWKIFLAVFLIISHIEFNKLSLRVISQIWSSGFELYLNENPETGMNEHLSSPSPWQQLIAVLEHSWLRVTAFPVSRSCVPLQLLLQLLCGVNLKLRN